MGIIMELLLYIVIILIIAVLIYTGCIFSIYFYARQKPQTNSGLFIITLSFLDLFAATFLLPQQLLFTELVFDYFEEKGYTLYTGRIYGATLIFVVLSYLFILTCIALDRVKAVWQPFSFTQSRKRTISIVAILLSFSLFASINMVTIERIIGTGGAVSRIIVVV